VRAVVDLRGSRVFLRSRWPTVAAGALVAVSMTACANATNTAKPTSTIPKNVSAGTPTTFGDLTENVPVHAKGVSDSEIVTDAVITLTNSPAGSFGGVADGVRAYFAMVNAGGGIYGRKLKLGTVHDDQLGNNRQAVQTALGSDNAFATFGATAIFTGASVLAAANQPTFIWNINPEFAGHNNIFGNVGALCFDCSDTYRPFIAQQLGAKKVGVIAYGVSQQSQLCAAGVEASFRKYPVADLVFVDKSLPFQAPLTADVAAMKRKGVQLVDACIDFSESYALAKEMQKQGLHAVQEQPFGYDADFVAKNGAPLEGSIVYAQFVEFEHQPRSPELQKLFQWAQTTGVTVRELTAYGWILADQLVTGLKLAGPNFSQQKVVDALNSLKAYDANGLIAPIDWTKQHADPRKDRKALPKLDCANFVKIHDSKFVPVFDQPGKPWGCFNQTDPTLDHPQYRSFGP
jgi:ABC-type branched-subunit amino acid transport system substrate-binding protein